MAAADHLHCAALVRERDRDRWLAALYAPARHREALIARHVLDLELAAVVAGTSDPMIGRIRLAWWREAVERLTLSGTTPAQPVLRALADAPPPMPLVDALVNAFEAMLDGEAAGAPRGEALFVLLADALTSESDPAVAAAGRVWGGDGGSLADLRWPKVTRPVTGLARVARLHGAPGSTKRQLALLAHIVTGRM